MAETVVEYTVLTVFQVHDPETLIYTSIMGKNAVKLVHLYNDVTDVVLNQ